MRFCTNCGETLADNVQICPRCGATVAPAQTSAPAQNETPASEPQNAGQTPAGQPQNAGQSGSFDQANSQPQGFAQPPVPGQAGAYQQPVYNYDPYDHTQEMDPRDIADNKILAIAMYLLGFVGIIVAVIAGKDSKYVAFHLRQVLKLKVVSVLSALIGALLCWTIIVPIAWAIFVIVLAVVDIIGIVNVFLGKAKELPIIRAFKFL